MQTQQRNNRFDTLLESLEKFDANMDKLRRIRSFLMTAIREAWRSSGQINLIDHVDLVVRLPIGAVNVMQVEVSCNANNLRTREDTWVRMRLLDGVGNEIQESTITSAGLNFLMLNPSPMIDAAAKFCEGLGCLEVFKGKVGRFCLIEYKI